MWVSLGSTLQLHQDFDHVTLTLSPPDDSALRQGVSQTHLVSLPSFIRGVWFENQYYITYYNILVLPDLLKMNDRNQYI